MKIDRGLDKVVISNGARLQVAAENRKMKSVPTYVQEARKVWAYAGGTTA
jgi:hypothetical protein